MNEIEKKEIEEMAKDSGGCDYPHRPCEKCWCKEEQECSAYSYATSFYKRGYRNCKDKVVLSKEELDKINELNAKNIKLEQEATARDIFNALGFITYRKQGKAYIFDVKELRELAKEYGVEVE